MARSEAKVADPFLPKESRTSKQPYYYIRVPIISDYEQPPPYLVIPLCPSKPRFRKCISCKCYCANLLLLIGLIFLIAMGFILWHSQPKPKVVHVQLNHMHISRGEDAAVLLDTSMDLQVKIQNEDFISYNYNLILILIGYNGMWLQPTMTNATFVNTRSVSYFEATVNLNGTHADLETPLEQRDNIIEGFVPLQIVIEVGARFHFFSIDIPVQGRISCSINVDVENQTIASQDCYPLQDIIMDLPML